MSTGTDWVKIKHEWCLGTLSLRQIAEPHGISEGYIRKRAKQEDWPPRDLGTKIRTKAEDLMQRRAANAARGSDPEAPVSERQIVNANAEQIAFIRQAHRTQIEGMRKLCETLKAELEADADLKVTVRIDAAKKLVDTLGRTIELERLAHSLDLYQEPEAPKEAIDVMDIARRAAFVLMQAAERSPAPGESPPVH